MTGTAAPTRYRRRPAASTSHTSVLHGGNQLRGTDQKNPDLRGASFSSREQAFTNKKRREKLLTLDSGTSTSLPKREKKKEKDPLVCFHLSSVRNKPARPDSSQCDQIPFKGRQRGSRSSATCPAHAAVLPCVRGRTECAGDRRAEESGAHKGRARGGCDFSCLHPGARTVLCLHASVVMSSPSTLARRHVFGGGSGVCVGGIKKK